MSNEAWAVIAPHKDKILVELEAVLKVAAIDNRGLLTSPRRAPATAKQIGGLWFDVLAGAAHSDQPANLATDLVEKGIAYETAAKAMQTLRQTTLDIARENPKTTLTALLALNTFSDLFLRKVAVGREALIAREQEHYQTTLQDSLRAHLEQQKQLAAQLESHHRRLQAVVDIAAAVSALADETDLLNRFVELTSISLNQVGVAILELSADMTKAIVRAVAGGRPGSLNIRQAQSVPTEGSLAQIVAGDDLVLSPLNAEADGLTYEIMAPLKTGPQLSGVLVLWNAEAALTADDVEFVKPLALLLSAAWQNVRLLAQSEQRAYELEIMHGERIRNIWQKADALPQQALIYDGVGVVASAETLQTVNDPNQSLILPIQVRNLPVGKLTLPVAERELSLEDKAFAESVITEMANALENANLVQDAQRRARREQTIREITDKMRSAVNLEALVKTTTEELGRHFSAEITSVKLGL